MSYAAVHHRRAELTLPLLDHYSMKTGRGALADYALMQPQLLVHKPSSLKHTEAASFPMAGLAAWQALFKSGGLQAGQRVFIVSSMAFPLPRTLTPIPILCRTAAAEASGSTPSRCASP